MLRLFKKKEIEKPDFYDLAFLFEANGFTEYEASQICEFIDSKGRSPLVVRKAIGRIVNRGEFNGDDVYLIINNSPHILPFSHKKTALVIHDNNAEAFLSILKEISLS